MPIQKEEEKSIGNGEVEQLLKRLLFISNLLTNLRLADKLLPMLVQAASHVERFWFLVIGGRLVEGDQVL